MKYSARSLGIDCINWNVFDLAQCRYRTDIAWVDDETHEYGQWDNGVDPDPTTKRANKYVVVFPTSKFVVLNAKDLGGVYEYDVETAIANNTERIL